MLLADELRAQVLDRLDEGGPLRMATFIAIATRLDMNHTMAGQTLQQMVVNKEIHQLNLSKPLRSFAGVR